MVDRARLLQMLRESSARFTASLRGLSPDQLAYKPAPDRWSILETAEHVTAAERGSGKLIRNKLPGMTATAEDLARTEKALALIDASLTVRDRIIPAPDFILPTGRWKTGDEVLAVFQESRDATIDFLTTAPAGIDQCVAPHPLLGPLTGSQWGYFLARHSDRHVLQIEETKRHPGYPSN
jgi:hypothetical protein